MAKLKIRHLGDEILRKKCRPVEAITPRILTLLDDMTETMRAADGCGLAAPQVGVLRRLVVIEVEEGKVIELINPKIITWSGEQTGLEGCLSVPGKWGIVTRPNVVRVRARAGITLRPAHVTVRALNRKGETFEISGSDLLARAFCHEIDHLDGKLYIDHALRMLDEEG